uniref:Sfi1 spindle body domain-containing protein n=1 Tax=Monopterus albus TaxID=43700 RepID=A0A3Q3KKV7_MONAL|nr:protein SFI1 homolog [Monopterus albus]
MYSNPRKPDLAALRPRIFSVRSTGDSKHVRKVHTRKVPYRVGYNWNKGGRLKELRIRHLARKFLKIWMQNTFGRIIPHKAKSHHNSVVLRRAFEGWREEWWTSRREWSLTLRAECHYRYYLYTLVFHSWQTFMSLEREKKSKVQKAQIFADRQRMRLVWDSWEVFTEMRRMKNRMLESALEQKRLTTMCSAWTLWQTRLQQCHDLHTLEDQALKQHALTLQRRAWLHWKEMHTTACHQKKAQSKALLHFILRLKRKTLYQWMSYVSSRQNKKKSEAVAQRAGSRRLVRMCWNRWINALHHRWSEEDCLRAAGYLAIQSTKRRALEQWRAYVTLSRQEAERNQMASQHYHHHLMSAGLQGLSLNVIWNKTHRLNNNMAIQHHHQTMMSKYWKLWQDRLEEAEDKSFQPLTEMAQRNYSMSLLSSSFHYWKEKLAEQRHMQELEHRAVVWFAEHTVPRYFNSWVEFTLQRRLHKHWRHTAEVYNQQRQYAWVFYTWWGQSEKHKEQMLSERMAILHAERCCMQRAWAHWSQRTEQQISEAEKQKASDHLYLHRLLHKTMTQWKDYSAEIRDRRSREQQACHQGDLRSMKWAVEKWKKFVQSQRVKKSKLEQMQRYHEVKLVKNAVVAWKTHHLQMSHIYRHAEQLHRQQKQRFVRTALSVWRENAVLLAEEQQAQNHFQHVLQLKVFLAWREATTRAVSNRHQQNEAVSRVQRARNQAQLLQFFTQWRKQTRDAQRERICVEKTRQHHNSRLLSKALKAWNRHHYQTRKYKMMKRQGLLLLKLKMYQTYFEAWKMKLQHRRREAKQTEQALWHWSLSLQAKVLNGWKLWVTEQHKKQEQAARAAQVYRDQLLREGVTCILTYAAHMNELTQSFTQHSQEQRSLHLQRVVKRCAMRWKQRALCNTQQVKGKPAKKSVTFCLTTPGMTSVSSSDPMEQGAEDGVLCMPFPTRMPRRQPRRCGGLFHSKLADLPHTGTQKQFGNTNTAEAASQKNRPAVMSCLLPAKVPVTAAYQSTITSTMSPSEPRTPTVSSPQGTQNQDLLLPPSAFMTTGTQVTLEATSSSGPFKHHSSTYPETRLRAFCVETEVEDPTSALTRELLNIQLDMKSFQQDRKQLRTWQKLKEVLQSWLQTSGNEEQMEKNDICQELQELEERISRLSTKLAKRKPTMLLHAERIQHLQTVLHTSGVIQEMETHRSVFTA